MTFRTSLDTPLQAMQYNHLIASAKAILDELCDARQRTHTHFLDPRDQTPPQNYGIKHAPKRFCALARKTRRAIRWPTRENASGRRFSPLSFAHGTRLEPRKTSAS